MGAGMAGVAEMLGGWPCSAVPLPSGPEFSRSPACLWFPGRKDSAMLLLPPHLPPVLWSLGLCDLSVGRTCPMPRARVGWWGLASCISVSPASGSKGAAFMEGSQVEPLFCACRVSTVPLSWCPLLPVRAAGLGCPRGGDSAAFTFCTLSVLGFPASGRAQARWSLRSPVL